MNEQITSADQKKPGRPPKQNIGMKKGKPTWKPASVTDVVNKEDGYRYRWAGKTADNLAKKEAEGWETVSKLNADKVTPTDDGKVHSGKQLTSTHEKHDLILMRMPEEIGQARDEYMNEKTRKRTLGLTAHLKKEIREKGGNAPIHGDITISSLREEQVID